MKMYRRGFTLIELLVVIGIIGILAGGIGLALKGGDSSSALKASQGIISGMLSGARGQAAITQGDAMIIVEAGDPSSDTFLRELRLVFRVGSSPDYWRPVGDPVMLPKDIYVVPPTTSLTGVTFVGTEWSAKRRSSGFRTSPVLNTLTEKEPDTGPTPVYTTPKTNLLVGKQYLCFQAFSSSGQLVDSNGVGSTLVVTTGVRKDANNIALDNPASVRGVQLSRYGVPAFINEGDTLDKVTTP